MFLKVTNLVFFLSLGALLVNKGLTLDFSVRSVELLAVVAGVAALILAVAQLFANDN